MIFALAACQHAPVAYTVNGVVTTDTPGSSGASAVRIDKEGNTIVAGVFENTFTLAGTTLRSYGRHDIFLAKFDPQFRLVWLESFGGPGNDFPPDVAVAPDGSVTLCCDFENMLNLSQRFALYADGHGQALIRVGPDGSGREVLEVSTKGGAHEVQVNALAAAGNDLRAVGNFSADTLFLRSYALDGTEKGRMFMLADGSATLFVMAIKENGPPALRTFHEDGSVYAMTNRIVASNDGGTILCGTHRGALRFGDKDASGDGVYHAILDADLAPVSAVGLKLTCSDPASLAVDGLSIGDAGEAWLLLGFNDNVRSHELGQQWNAGAGKDALLLGITSAGEVASALRFGNGDDLFVKSVTYDAVRRALVAVGYHHGALQLTDKVQLPAGGKFNAFVIGLDLDLKIRTLLHSSGAGQQFVLAMDAREGEVAIAGTYFQAGTIGPVELPQPGGRFFAGTMNAPAN